MLIAKQVGGLDGGVRTFSNNPIAEDVSRGVGSGGGGSGDHEAGGRHGLVAVVAVATAVTLLVVGLVALLVRCRKGRKRRCQRGTALESENDSSSKLCTTPSNVNGHTLFAPAAANGNSSGGVGRMGHLNHHHLNNMNSHHHLNNLHQPRPEVVDGGGGFEPRPLVGVGLDHNHHLNNHLHRRLDLLQTPPPRLVGGQYFLGSRDLVPDDVDDGGGDLGAADTLQQLDEDDEEPWVELQRSTTRDTSPDASSIPPGMPAFRVIPLAEFANRSDDPEDSHEDDRSSSSFLAAAAASTSSGGGPLDGGPQLLRRDQYWV